MREKFVGRQLVPPRGKGKNNGKGLGRESSSSSSSFLPPFQRNFIIKASIVDAAPFSFSAFAPSTSTRRRRLTLRFTESLTHLNRLRHAQRHRRRRRRQRRGKALRDTGSHSELVIENIPQGHHSFSSLLFLMHSKNLHSGALALNKTRMADASATQHPLAPLSSRSQCSVPPSATEMQASNRWHSKLGFAVFTVSATS